MNGIVRTLAVLLAFGMVFSQSIMISGNANSTYVEIDADDIDFNIVENEIGDERKPSSPKDENVVFGYKSPVISSGGIMDTISGVPGLGNWSFRDAHQIDLAEGLGYNGSGIVVGVADSGVDFCKSELQDALMIGPDGWPMVMDITSLREYLGRNLITEDSWFADTSFNASVNGTVLPSFEYFHSPHFTMNGRADDFNSIDKKFMDTKEVTTMGQFWDGDSWVSLDTIGGKDFDLQNLYVSRDRDNWYFGFNTRNAQVNRSYGLYLDFDNATGGASIGPTGLPDPRGNYVDAEAAHTSRVNSVAYHPNVNDQKLLASCADGILGGSDRECIHIWDENGHLVKVLSNPTNEIDEFKSVRWSPSGDRLVASTRLSMFSWDTSTWELVGGYGISAPGITDFLSINPAGTLAAAANGTRVTLVNPADMAFFNSPHAGGGAVQKVEFSPSGDRLAVGINDGYVRIFNSADLDQPAPACIMEFSSSFTGNGHEMGWPVKSLAWSPDGTYLATGGDDGRVFIWDTGTGNIAASWNGSAGHPILSPPASYAISGIVWSGGQIVVSTGNGTYCVINQAGFSMEKVLRNSNSYPVSCSRPGIGMGTIFAGSDNAAIRLVNITSSTPSNLNYLPWVLYKPDIVVYADYVAETYTVDENGIKGIGTADRIEDPSVYQFNAGAWASSSLNDYGENLYYYRGNKDVSSESDGLTEITSLGFVEIAIPRNITDIYGTNSLSVKLFVTGEMASVAQDCVPSDNNVKSYETDFDTAKTTSLSSFGYVQFPHTTIELTSIESKSGVYHYGFHPSDTLSNFIQKAVTGSSDYVGILVVDANTEGVYDTVIVDLNVPASPSIKTPLPNYAFDDDDPVATKGSPFITIDMLDTAGQKMPDGIMDYSAGLVYHISDGTPLPYSTRIKDLEIMKFDDDHPMPVPGNGDVVCFFGEFETYTEGEEELPRKTGTVGASAIGARGAYDDPNGFGIMSGAATGVKMMAVGRAGNHFQSSIRFLVEGHDGIPGTGDDCSIVYVGSMTSSYTSGLDSSSHFLDYMALDYLNGNVTFVLPAGNDGPGMGTIVSPSPRNALVVGSTMDNAYDPNIHPEHLFGDVAQWSSRGPTSAGYPKPDIVASGIGRFSEPLIHVNTPGGGIMNVQTFKDSRIAAAISAGVAAQVQEAFFKTHGRLPNMYETIGILKASATDMGYDVLVQGSGLLNALGAVRMASDDGGIMLNGIDLAPSNYWSQDYRGFPQIMSQGSSASSAIGIQNTGPATQAVVVPERYEPVWLHTADFSSTKTILLNFTDIMPLNITYLRVTAMASAGDFFKESMEVNVVVKNVFVISDWTDDSDPFPEYGDMNVLCKAEQDNSEQVLTNVIELGVGQPHQKFDSNIWFALKSETFCDWKVTLTGYAPEAWDWITLDQAPIDFDAGQEGTVAITATVPQDALPGTYSGSVRVMSDLTNVSNEMVYTPPSGSLVNVVYEEVGITAGNDTGTLANTNILGDSLELVQTNEVSGSWISYRNGPDPADNNAAFIMTQEENIPWSFQIPSAPGVPNGTPIYDVLVSWGGDSDTPGDPSDDWWEPLDDSSGNEIGVDYTVDFFTGGFVTFIRDTWNYDGTIGWAGCEFYINYTYQSQIVTPLYSPADYSVNPASGVITFTSAIDTSTSNVTANYTYVMGGFQRLCLANCRISGNMELTRFNTLTGIAAAVPESDYDFSPLTGVVMFNSPQSAIYMVNASYDYHMSEAIIPIVVNVGASQIPSYSIGGEANDWINSPTTMNGGYNFGLNNMAGDRRYFYFTVPNKGLFTNTDNFRSIFDLEWGDVPTDIDISIYSSDGEFISLSEEIGPYIMKEIGKGPSSAIPAGFMTSSGGANETISFQFSPGLNVICLRGKLLSGTSESHAFKGTGGYLTFSAAKDRVISTNQLGGSLPLEVMSNVDMSRGFFSSVLGPAIGKTYTAEEVYQDAIFHDITQEDWWRINSDAKYTKLIDVPDGTLSLDVRIMGYENCPDLDLCLFYDGKNGKKDGVAQWDEFIDRTVCEDIDNYGWGGIGTNFNTYAYSAGAGSDEATKILKPMPGTWIVKVVGYEVTGNPGNFDLIVKMIKDGVKGYEMSSPTLSDTDASENALTHNEAVPPFTILDFNIDWNFPPRTAEDGGYSGVVTIGNVYSRDVMTLPIEIFLDRSAPLLTENLPKQGAYVRDPYSMIFCSFSDEERGQIDGSTVRLFVDGRDVTTESTISVPYTRASLNDPFGYWGGSVMWVPLVALPEGGHLARAIARDFAGNLFEHTWSFTVDTIAPELRLSDGEEILYANVPRISLNGYLEPGAELAAFATCEHTLMRYESGDFRIDMELSDPENELVLTATDLAGNSCSLRRAIIFDQDIPGFTRLFSSEGALTNSESTSIYGTVSEPGTLMIGGEAVGVNSDGSFMRLVPLSEGENAIDVVFTDMAGNSVARTMDVFRDTAKPNVRLVDVPRTVSSQVLNITIETEPDAQVRVNGYSASEVGSRQQDIALFTYSVKLSPGVNTIVVSSTDRAGNIAQDAFAVTYEVPPAPPGSETPQEQARAVNYAAIGVMAALLVVGLVLGLLLGPMIFGGRKEELPEEAEPPLEDMPESLESGEAPEEEMPPEGEEIPEEETHPEEEEGGPGTPDDAPGMPGEETEESLPREEEAPKGEIKPAPGEGAVPGEAPETEAVPEEPEAGELRAEPAPEDPRIAKLKSAYESGKISKELYEKNLRKFQGS